MVHALIYAPVDEPILQTCLRRLALCVATWLCAYIYHVLSETERAVEQCSSQPSAAAAPSSAQPLPVGVASVVTGTLPPVAATPVVKAGFSVPHVPRGSTTRHAWTDVPADNFRVRCGPDYAKKGLKAPSAPALGTVVGVDCLRSSGKIFNIMALNYIALPEPTPGWQEPYPEFLVINQQLPVEFHNSVFTSASTDGETLHLIVYVRLRPGLAPDYRSDQEPLDAEQLLKRCARLLARTHARAHSRAHTRAHACAHRRRQGSMLHHGAETRLGARVYVYVLLPHVGRAASCCEPTRTRTSPTASRRLG